MIEQLAALIVFTILGALAVMVKVLSNQKAELQKRVETEAMNKIHMESMNELIKKNPDLSSLVNDINERIRKERGG